MEWNKVTIETNSQGVELIVGVLMSCNITSVEIIDPNARIRDLENSILNWDYADEALTQVESDLSYIIFYVTADEAGDSMIKGVSTELEYVKTFTTFAERGSLNIARSSVNDETWLHEWKKHFHAIKLGKVVVSPEWEDYSPTDDEIVFKIEPGSAFGTGQHQSTQLVIMALQDYMQPSAKVLDIGCGSGILSITSLLLGAHSVFACDIDPAGAIAATKNNAALNPVDTSRLSIHSGDALSDENLKATISKNKYDIVLVNIVADVIVELAPFIRTILAPDGIVISSGIIKERAQDVLSAFRSADIEIVEQRLLDEWVMIAGRVSYA